MALGSTIVLRTSQGLLFVCGLAPEEMQEAHEANQSGAFLSWHADLMRRRVLKLYESRL